jgi:hypothetical protein
MRAKLFSAMKAQGQENYFGEENPEPLRAFA